MDNNVFHVVLSGWKKMYQLQHHRHIKIKYSSHSSGKEIKHFVKILRPRNLYYNTKLYLDNDNAVNLMGQIFGFTEKGKEMGIMASTQQSKLNFGKKQEDEDLGTVIKNYKEEQQELSQSKKRKFQSICDLAKECNVPEQIVDSKQQDLIRKQRNYEQNQLVDEQVKRRKLDLNKLGQKNKLENYFSQKSADHKSSEEVVQLLNPQKPEVITELPKSQEAEKKATPVSSEGLGDKSTASEITGMSIEEYRKAFQK